MAGINMAGHIDGVHAVIEKFKSISSKKDRILYACSVIEGFRGHGKQVNPAHADEFLTAVLPFIESNLNFANSHDEWISALVGIIEDHAASSCSDNVLKNFMGVLERLRLFDALVKSIGTILVNDISYATQEIALDIICRMAMLSSISPQSPLMKHLLAAMPNSIQIALRDPNIGPQGMLVNMRPSLIEINKKNENVKSFAISAFGIEVARSVPYKRKISGATWLDLSKEIFTIYIPEKDMMVKFSYHLITRVHFASASNTMQIGLESAPGRIEELIQVDEQAPQGKPMYFFVEFGLGNTETMEGARAEFSLRLENAEALVLTDRLEKRRKYSIISTRDQTPEDLKSALFRFNQSRYPEVVLETLKGPEAVREIEKEAKVAVLSVGDAGKVMEATQKAVVTASKKGKQPHTMDEHNDDQLESRYEDNLTAITSPETEPREVEEDRGYSRHKLKKDPVGPKGSTAVAPPLVITPPRLTRSALADIPAKALAKDQAQPTVTKSYKAETPKEKETSVMPTNKAAKNTKANTVKANVSGRKRSIDKKDGMAPYRAGKILIPTDEDLGAPATTRKTSTVVSALQDITNSSTPQLTRNVTGPKEVTVSYTYDEKNDPNEVSSQPTPVHNSRRRSYKAKPPVTALEPTPAQISVFAVGRAAMRDALFGATAAIKAKTVEPFVNLIHTPRKVREEGIKSATARSASTAKKVNARMRTNTISEEEEDPKERGAKSPVAETMKQPMNVYSAKRKQKEEVKRDDPTENDYNDADDGVSYNNEEDAEEGEEKVAKKSRVSVDEEAKQILLLPKEPPREGGSQNTVGTATSWRPNAALTTFSSDTSSTDDSASKEADTAFTVKLLAPAVRAKGDADQGKNKTDRRRKSKEPEVTKPLSPVESSQEDDADSTFSRPPLASQESENQDPKAWELSKRGRDVDSGSDGDEPSSDEDGVIAMLLEELVTMQKSRASRKKARLMTSAVDAATVQVNSYLKQWSDFTDTSCADLQSAMTLKLEALCASADAVCEGLVKDGSRFEEEGREMQATVQGIEADVGVLQTEIGAASTLQKEEEAALKSALAARKKAAVEGARKSIGHLKKDRGAQSNRQNTKQLMLALRDL